MVLMVLNPNETEPTFLNFIRGRRGRVLLLCIKLDKEKKNSSKKISFMHTKNI